MILNCTPHDIHCHISGEVRTILRSGAIVRAASTREDAGSLEGIPLDRVNFGAAEGLPDFTGVSAIIVSSLAAAALKGDSRIPPGVMILVPGEGIRDEKGNIVGCRGLSLA